MIPTLGRGLLYHVHRNKQDMLNAAERRRAIILSVAILVCVGAIVYFWL